MKLSESLKDGAAGKMLMMDGTKFQIMSTIEGGREKAFGDWF